MWRWEGDAIIKMLLSGLIKEKAMTVSDLQQVLTAARQLPKPSQAELVSTLLRETMPMSTASLQPLTGLSEAELHALGESVLAPGHERRLKQLLRLNREKKLPRSLKAELDALLEESDRVALMKAKANYTLSLYAA